MSQTSFLKHVAQWSREECLQNLDDALPKLITRVKSSDQQSILEPLRLVCQSFLPVCPTERLEDEIFNKIKEIVVATSAQMYDELSSLVKQTSTAVEQLHVQLATVLQTSMELLGCVDEFVCCLKTREHKMSLRPEHVHSLPSMVLPLLQHSYTHCKNSSQVYGEILELLTEQLSALFKRAHILQMNFLGLLDMVSYNNPTDQDISDLCQVVRGLHEISLVAVSLDVKIMIVMWKTISRLACQHKVSLQSCLEVDPMLLSLTTDMESSFSYMIQTFASGNQKDEKTFAKTTKVLGFQMKVLVTMVKEYESVLLECAPAIIKLLIAIQSVLPPSVSSTHMLAGQQSEIHKQLGVAVEPLVSYLIPSTSFRLAISMVHKESNFSRWLPLGMILITVLKMLPNYSKDIQTSWINPKQDPEEVRQPLLNTVFNTIPHCHTELSLPASIPSIMCKGRPQRNVSYYHHLLSQICVFVATHPAQHFHVLEECLLENVSSLNVHNSLLATDVWCFMARYGTAELCYDHCVLLGNLLQKSGVSSHVQCCHLVNTLRRLFKFLAPEHQEAFIRKFPAVCNIGLYSILPLSVFSGACQQQLSTQLLSTCTTVVNSWIQTDSHRTSDAAKLAEVYRTLCNLCSHAISLDSSTYSELVKPSITCLLSLPYTLPAHGTDVHLATANILHYLAYLTKHMDNKLIYQILTQLSTSLKNNHLEAVVKLAVLYFLRSLGKHVFSPDLQQVPILRELPRIFSPLLGDHNALVKQVALGSFARFAEETVHETIVPESLQSDEKTQTTVVSYLNDLSNECPPCTIDYDILKYQQDYLNKNLRIDYVTMDTDGSTQPPAKRCRLDESGEELSSLCEEGVRMLLCGTDQLQRVSTELGHVPQVYTHQIRQVLHQLQNIISNNS